ncbi:heme exporter protein CcmD [Chthonobacter albigriseus]|uniref:heme exporter protein CcmD n=1 Tax=Chthonobacter albigriseus TaxID=1683161 RepID=UPI0015EE6176|nr:heme exporter protein CcmD [Chthonobacter albigriseus]
MENLFGLGPHAGFIVVSYAAAALTVAALVVWILVDHRTQTRRLAELEARGVRRRSAAKAAAVAGQESGA